MCFCSEITFENAEELTEEGLPFLIMFHASDDTESIKLFKTIVETQLLPEKRTLISTLLADCLYLSLNDRNILYSFFFFAENINFLTADGKRFAHPLHHLGKSQADLPLIAIDSFRHMYLFKDFKDITVDGKLKQFVADLHSGKLHRYANMHMETMNSNLIWKNSQTEINDYYTLRREFHYGPEESENEVKTDDEVEQVKVTTPPESTFKKLAPSKNRYTLLRDEL